MDVLTKILSLLKEQGKQQKDLADFLGIQKNNITDWKAGRSKSYTKYLYQIASYLGTTPAYLLGETDQKEKPAFSDGQGMDEQTIAFSHKLDRLTEDERKAVSDFVDLILRQRNGQS